MRKRLLLLLTILMLLLPDVNASALEYDESFEDYIEAVCEERNICPELVEALIFYESSWDVDVVSAGGCIGLMQINPNAHSKRMKELGVNNLKNGHQNILVGVELLMDLFDQYGEAHIVLDAYNGQLKTMDRYKTGYISNYATKVLDLSEQLERDHGK